jgi:hypothetical protein
MGSDAFVSALEASFTWFGFFSSTRGLRHGRNRVQRGE